MDTSLSPVDLVHNAIAAGLFGHIQWDDRADTLARSNADLQGLTPEGIRRLLHAFVSGGGRLTRGARHAPIGLKRMRTGRLIIGIAGIGQWSRFRLHSPLACSS